METVTLSPGNYFPTSRANPSVELPELPNGKYKVTLATKDNALENSQWLPMVCDWGNINYCILSVEDGLMSVSNVSPDVLKFIDSSFVSPLFYGRNLKIVSRIKNSSDKQLSLCYIPVLYRDGAIQYLGDMTLVTVEANSEIEKPEIVHFLENEGATSTGLGTYQLRIMDASTNKFIGEFGEYEMVIASNSLKVEADEFAIADASQQKITLGSKTFDDVYVVEDAYDFSAILKYSVISGYLDSELKIIGARYDSQSGKFINMDETVFSEYPYAGQGQSRDISIPLNFIGEDLATVYRLTAGYMDGNKTKSLSSIYITFDLSGVEDMFVDQVQEDVRYFNLQGVPVKYPKAGDVLLRQIGDKVKKIKY